MNRFITTLAIFLVTTPAWAQDAEPVDAPPAADVQPSPADVQPSPGEPAETVEPAPEPKAAEATANAAAPAADEPIYRRGGLFGTGIVVAPKFGVGFGQVFGDFGTSPVFELELGWVFKPFPDLQIFTSLSYVSPKQEGGGTDTRLGGTGEWTYQLKQESLVLTPGLLYRIPVGGALFRPYVAAGPRFYFNRTTVQGYTGPEAFGEYKEKGSSFGVYGALGGDLFVGPGSILLEIQAGTSHIDEYVLRDTNNAALNIAVGYRFFL